MAKGDLRVVVRTRDGERTLAASDLLAALWRRVVSASRAPMERRLLTGAVGRRERRTAETVAVLRS